MQINSRLAKRTTKINPSSTLAITSKAKKLKAEGRDIIGFGAGEPDVDTPDFIKDAAIQALKAGFTKYTPTTGIPELKTLIAAKFKKDNSLEYNSSQIIVSCGAKHSIFNALFALIDEGDEVVIGLPFWVSYPEMVNMCGGTPRFVRTSAKNSFKITPQELEENINSKTKLFILNSPSNPTGCVYNEKELRQIADICVKHKIFVLSDEIYEKIIYDNLKHVSIASFNKDIYDLTITVNGLSKSHSMTGWRIGYLAAHQNIADAISKIQDHSTSNPNSIAQKGALAALSMPDDFSNAMRVEFEKRRNYVVGRLKKISKLGFVMPQGAFYIFCDISKTKIDSITFANRLLDEVGVAVIPGDGFGRDDYMRISFATGMKQLEEGINRIENWMNKI